MSNSKERLKKGFYITEAMLDAISPLYDFCITNPRSNNRVDITSYEPSKFTFKDIDQIPSIGDIVFESKLNRIIKVKQITVTGGKVSISDYTGRLNANWYDLDIIHPIKLDHQILIDLGFELYGKDICGANKYRLVLYTFLNLKLTLDSYDGNLDRMIWIQEGRPLIHYLHELQGILRISGRDKILKKEQFLVKVLTKSEYPLNTLPENNTTTTDWVNN